MHPYTPDSRSNRAQVRLICQRKLNARVSAVSRCRWKSYITWKDIKVSAVSYLCMPFEDTSILTSLNKF